MKYSIFTILIIAAMMSSCSNNGKHAETKDAANVEVVKNNQTGTFTKITPESHLNWKASHLGGVQQRYGKVKLKSAEFLVNDGKLTNAKVLVDLSTLTVESFPAGAPQIAKLTGHLKSPDFFNIEKYPTAKFELTSIKPGSGSFNSVVTGNLTILDKTKSITFNANVNVSGDKVSIKSEDFSVNRTDWGLTYNTEGTAGVPKDYLIANDIGFKIDVTATK